MTREQLLDFQARINRSLNDLRSQITEAKRRGAAERKFVPVEQLQEMERRLAAQGRLSQAIQTRLGELRDQERKRNVIVDWERRLMFRFHEVAKSRLEGGLYQLLLTEARSSLTNADQVP